jgi:hypothetical protein
VVFVESLESFGALLNGTVGDFAVDLLAYGVDLRLEGALTHHLLIPRLQIPQQRPSLLPRPSATLFQDVFLAQLFTDLQTHLVQLWLVLLILEKVVLPQGVFLGPRVVPPQDLARPLLATRPALTPIAPAVAFPVLLAAGDEYFACVGVAVAFREGLVLVRDFSGVRLFHLVVELLADSVGQQLGNVVLQLVATAKLLRLSLDVRLGIDHDHLRPPIADIDLHLDPARD